MVARSIVHEVSRLTAKSSGKPVTLTLQPVVAPAGYVILRADHRILFEGSSAKLGCDVELVRMLDADALSILANGIVSIARAILGGVCRG